MHNIQSQSYRGLQRQVRFCDPDMNPTTLYELWDASNREVLDTFGLRSLMRKHKFTSGLVAPDQTVYNSIGDAMLDKLSIY